MNHYEQKQEARRERLERAADRHEAKSEAAFRGVRKIADGIPFGQPILVGHHSERHARRDADRIHNGMRRGIDEAERAKELRGKAAAVGTGGVSSDDPEAVQKLLEQLAKEERTQALEKAINAAIRKAKKGGPDAQVAAIVALELPDGKHLSEGTARRLLEPDYLGRIGFPDYELTNRSANIRRLRARIEELRQKARVREALEAEARETGDDTKTRMEWASGQAGGLSFRIVDDVSDNRTRVEFCGKPIADVRAHLKAAGFRWSPERGAWVRHLSIGAVYAACYALGVPWDPIAAAMRATHPPAAD